MLKINHAGLLWRGLLILLFSWIYVFFPWTEFVGVNPDTFNYLNDIKNLLIQGDAGSSGMNVFQWVFSEPLWRSILILVGNCFHDPFNGLRFISFVCIFTFTLFLFMRIRNYFLVLFFLLNPLVVDLVMFQTRSALAVALCLGALMVRIRPLILILIVMASLIHSAIFVILGVYLYARFLEKNENRFDYKWLSLFSLVFAAVLSVVLGPGRESILGAMGDRRAIYDTDMNSFLYLGFWLLLAVILSVAHRRNSSTKCRAEYYSIVMLSLPFFMRMLSVNGVRFIALSFPFILYAILRSVTPFRELLISSLFIYQSVQYVYWLRMI